MVYPLFIMDDETIDSNSDTNIPIKEEIPSMPDCYRHNLISMMNEIEEAIRYIQSITYIYFYTIHTSL